MTLIRSTMALIRKHARWLLIASTLASTAALAQEIELYGQPDFRGSRLGLDAAAADLGVYGARNQVSSLIIHRGSWELCGQVQFRGVCITLGPGRYARLPGGLDERLRSLRPAQTGVMRPPAPPPPLPFPTPQRPTPQRPSVAPGQVAIVLYGQQYAGQELLLYDAERNLASRAFNDSATHIEVLAGTWELCSDGGFSGQCLRYGPGRYPLGPDLRDRLSSLRPLGPGMAGSPPPAVFPPVLQPNRPGLDRPGSRPWAGARPAIVFYENARFGGRELPLVGAAPNFVELDFNDRASSVEVFRGRWQVCRHIDFGGECLVLGPGRYDLSRNLNDAVSSARPLSGRGDQPLANTGAVTLHDDDNFRGRSLLVEGAVDNLRNLGFNDRSVAIEVHAGRWELCSSAGYQGRCQDFGPGWYRLPPGLAGELSSLRPR